MHGKTLGIVGCGRIGLVVASCANAMGMRVLGYDPVMSKEGFAAAKITQAPKLDQIWKEADFITLHTPLTPETSNLLNDETLAKCKKGVRIVNCARGGIGKSIEIFYPITNLTCESFLKSTNKHYCVH